MQQPDRIFISSEFRFRAQALATRLGAIQVSASPRWQAFADRLELPQTDLSQANTSTGSVEPATVVVGPLAVVLKRAAIETGEFGFVMPVAQTCPWWRRGLRWRDDATLALWGLGWSIVAVDRLLVATEQATLEFAIGNARPTPLVDQRGE